MIYLDNNATTFMPARVIKAMNEWCNMGNPSAGYRSAKKSRLMMEEFRQYIGKLCNFESCCIEPRDGRAIQKPDSYKILFTSGASESNVTIINGVISSYRAVKKRLPHLIVSAIEHKSIIDAVNCFVDRGMASVTYINPRKSGHILASDVEAAILCNTCLICVMHANNETGAINDIESIIKISHKHKIPVHCDMVQTFGKYPPDVRRLDVDSFSVSFHKFGGPPGVGILVVKGQFLTGYKLPPLIFGTQNEKLRGGTENLPGIGASFEAFKININNREEKNKKILTLKKYMITELCKKIKVRSYIDYTGSPVGSDCEIVLLSGLNGYLNNTILLSLVKYTKPKICNVKIKEGLESKNIIISVGSACNTSSTKASHVLDSMKADELIKAGALRISLSEYNTIDHINTFINEFFKIIKKQL